MFALVVVVAFDLEPKLEPRASRIASCETRLLYGLELVPCLTAWRALK